jgi:glutathione gamma-glutamylcysteinyltransferase
METKQATDHSPSDYDDSHSMQQQEQPQQDENSDNDESSYPPPLPEPKVTFRRRVLPSHLVALSGPQGQQALLRAMTQQTAATYFMLTQHWDNQSDPASCGVTTLRQVLNAAGMDPTAIRWKGGWRYYGSDAMVICHCMDPIRIQRAGITLADFDRLAHCHGIQGHWERPDTIRNTTTTTTVTIANDTTMSTTAHHQHNTIDDFRRDVMTSLQSTTTQEDDDNSTTVPPSAPTFLVVSFSRAVLQQTGDGHFSTIAAYDTRTDSCLVLDVARFKYPPYWVKLSELYEAMRPIDPVTQQSRGWSLWQRAGPWPTYLNAIDGNVYDDGALPATWVPAFDQTNDSACPLRPIQVQYCSTAWERRNQRHDEKSSSNTTKKR